MTTTGIKTAAKDALASGGLSYTRRNGGGTVRVVLAGNGTTQRISGTGPEGRHADRAGANEKGRMSDQGGACGFALCNAIATAAFTATSQGQGVSVADGYTLVPGFSNIYWATSVEADLAFQTDLLSIVAAARSRGLTDFDDLDSVAGQQNTPVFLTNKYKGVPDASMHTSPIVTADGPAVLISINPRSGLLLPAGRGVQSPATGAIHEVNHGINLIRAGVITFAAMSPRDQRRWQRADDASVIQGPEARAAAAFGDPPRRRHDEGSAVRVTCPVCRTRSSR
jgi:hypothetical protein